MMLETVSDTPRALVKGVLFPAVVAVCDSELRVAMNVRRRSQQRQRRGTLLQIYCHVT